MNEQKTYEQLLRDVADLKQIVCELARHHEIMVRAIHADRETIQYVDWWSAVEKLEKSSAAIANRLNPINFCADCQSPIKYRVIPCWGQSGVGCDCPDKPLLNISTLTAELGNGDQAMALSDWNIQYIPPVWLNPTPTAPDCTEGSESFIPQ